MEFWLGLAVRYRLPRRKRVESPSLELVRNLLLGRPLRLDHLLFPFSPQLYKPVDGFPIGDRSAFSPAGVSLTVARCFSLRLSIQP